jgi:hypothetical protein
MTGNSEPKSSERLASIEEFKAALSQLIADRAIEATNDESYMIGGEK